MSANKQAKTKKVALDEVAKAYWVEYYRDSNYGEAWVREIPKRVKAELEKRNASLKSASETELVIRPIASVPTENGGQSLEAMAVLPDQTKIAFVADFDKDGNVLDFEAFELVTESL